MSVHHLRKTDFICLICCWCFLFLSLLPSSFIRFSKRPFNIYFYYLLCVVWFLLFLCVCLCERTLFHFTIFHRSVHLLSALYLLGLFYFIFQLFFSFLQNNNIHLFGWLQMKMMRFILYFICSQFCFPRLACLCLANSIPRINEYLSVSLCLSVCLCTNVCLFVRIASS